MPFCWKTFQIPPFIIHMAGWFLKKSFEVLNWFAPLTKVTCPIKVCELTRFFFNPLPKPLQLCKIGHPRTVQEFVVCIFNKIKMFYGILFTMQFHSLTVKGTLIKEWSQSLKGQLTTIEYQAACGFEISCINMADIKNIFKFSWQKDTKQKKMFYTNIFLFTNLPYWQVLPQQMHIESSLQIAHAPFW